MNYPQQERRAYGVDPTRKERYSLRQARYQAIADELDRFAREFHQEERPLKLLDVGVDTGVTLRYLEALACARRIELVGLDIRFHRSLYRPERWTLLRGDVTEGLPFLPDDSFDVVICEQVLEHLPDVSVPMATLARVLRPGGILIVGVPIFPPGVHLLRRHIVPVIDQIVRRRRPRGHLQAWSCGTFLRDMKRHTGLDNLQARGFRVVSGGPLRALENHAWWWRLNRRLGSLLPSLCTEVQVVATKPKATAATNEGAEGATIPFTSSTTREQRSHAA